MLKFQIFPGLCHKIVMSPQVHVTHYFIPSALHSSWPVVDSRGVLFLWNTSFKENFHRGVCGSCIQFLRVCNSQCTFHNLYFYIIFCANFYLGVEYILPFLVTLHECTQMTHKLNWCIMLAQPFVPMVLPFVEHLF